MRMLPRKMLYYESRVRRAGHSSIAGVDESGRGPLAGPVVAASVIIKDFNFVNRIDDSKVLSPKLRRAAYEEIIDKSVYGIGIIDVSIIDMINIYQATIRAMEKAIKSMEVEPDYILIDGGVKLNLPQKKSYITGGDSKSLTIACASIIAKVTRDKIMERYDHKYPQYGFRQHKGYGTLQHFKAIAKLGPSPIHRLSFRPFNPNFAIAKFARRAA